MKTIVVGDIHGYRKELGDALYNASYEDGDKLVFLGDYIDRGPRSREVLEHLVALSGDPRHVFLRGNHEDLFLRALQGDLIAYYVLMSNGLISTLTSYGVDPSTLCYSQSRHYIEQDGKLVHLDGPGLTAFLRSVFPSEHLAFIENTRYYFEIGSYFYSHAGAIPCTPLHEQSGRDFLRGDDRSFLKQKYSYGKTMVFGHWHLMDPLVDTGKICLGMEMGVRILLPDYSPMVIVDSGGDHFEVRDEWLLT